MTAKATYKGYTMTPLGFKTIQVVNTQGYRHNENRMTYRVDRPDGTPIGRAFSMAEAKSFINEDISERMLAEMREDDAWVDDMEGME